MTSDLAAIRRFIMTFFSDEELSTLAFDYFPAVYEDFGAGMAKSQKARMLVEYSRSRDRLADLLSALEREREQVYREHLGAVVAEPAPPPPIPAAPARRDPRQIFISHAHQDAAFAQRLAEVLTGHGWGVWVAPDSIRPGEKWVEAINRGLKESGVFVLVLSPAAAASRWVRMETDAAIQWEVQERIRFIPLRLTEADVGDAPALWQTYQQVPFSAGFDRGLEALLTELEPERMAAVRGQYRLLQEAAANGDWAAVCELGNALEAEYPRYRDVPQRLVEAGAALTRAQSRETELAQLYAALQAAVRAREWLHALDIGEQMLRLAPAYRDAEKLLAEASAGLQAQRREARLNLLYVQLQAARAAGDWEDVLGYGRAIRRADADYRDVPQLVAEAEAEQQPAPEPRARQQAQAPQRQAAPAWSVPRWAWGAAGLVVVALVVWGLSSLGGGGGTGGAVEAEPAGGEAVAVGLAEPTTTAAATPTFIAEEESAVESEAPAVARTSSESPSPTTTSTNTPPKTATSAPSPTAEQVPPAAQPTAGEPWTRPPDQMVMLWVPAGNFPMGSETGDDDERPVHDVTLDDFWIDQTEVTNAQYALCVADGECERPEYIDDPRFSGDNHPVVGVSWFDAQAYCTWAEARLPTEAEWEYAARGSDGNVYPWGNAPPSCNLARYGSCETQSAPVGSFPDGASWIGALDTVGNVWEWVADWYSSNYYADSPAQNPTGPASGEHKVLRSSSWGYIDALPAAERKLALDPSSRYGDIGFRCAHD